MRVGFGCRFLLSKEKSVERKGNFDRWMLRYVTPKLCLLEIWGTRYASFFTFCACQVENHESDIGL